MRTYALNIEGLDVVLHGLRGMYIVDHSTLVISDVHLGKASHFRKNGIAIPHEVSFRDLFKLNVLIEDFKPKNVMFLGDLFHSDYNREWIELGELIGRWNSIAWQLIPGNHDLLDQEQYREVGIDLMDEQVLIDGVRFQHEPPDQATSSYVVAGHIHPGVRMKGRGRRSKVLPCFFFGENMGILPSFGSFTGASPIKIKTTDRVIPVIDESLHVNM